MSRSFAKFAQWMARQAGKASTFVAALILLVAWAASGPLFGWSDTWQLIINTGTTIITFLMVFLIQNTQNRDTEALHLKLDELIRATKDAPNSAMDLENRSEEQLDAMKAELLRKQKAPRSGAVGGEFRSKVPLACSRPSRTGPELRLIDLDLRDNCVCKSSARYETEPVAASSAVDPVPKIEERRCR